MTSHANGRAHAAKPSGPVTYTVSSGADVWPGIDKGLERILDGETAMLQETRRHMVTVSVGGRNRLLPKAAWRALPIYGD